MTVLWDARDPEIDHRARACPRNDCSLQRQCSGYWHSNATHHIGEQALAIARDTGNSQNFSSADIKRNAVKDLGIVPGMNSVQAQDNISCLLDPGLGLRNAAANHQFGKFGSCDPFNAAFRHQLAAAQDADTAAGGENFAKLVGNENNGEALCHKALQGVKQGGRFLRRENRGGFVKNQNPGFPVKSLENFNTLALAHRKRCNNRIRVYFQSKFPRQLLNTGAGLLGVERRTATGIPFRAQYCQARSDFQRG